MFATNAHRAIDLGYGWVKFTTGETIKLDGQLPTVPVNTFSSLVWANPQQFNVPEMGGAKVMTLKFDGTTYGISKEPESVAPRSATRIKGDDYVSSTPYAVCMAAAIKAMRVGSIQRLVVGTPVGNFSTAREELVRRFSRGITFDDLHVEIGQLRVVPQPIGGLFWHMIAGGRTAEIANKVRLLIDVGYGTLDWVVAHGAAANAASSGSNDYGVSKFVDAVAAQIRGAAQGISADLLFTSSVDKMITMGRGFEFRGKEQRREQYAHVIDALAVEALADLKSRVGSLDMVSSIVLMGGGANLYASALKTVAGDVPIETVSEPHLANVRGFQLLSESGMKRHEPQ